MPGEVRLPTIRQRVVADYATLRQARLESGRLSTELRRVGPAAGSASRATAGLGVSSSRAQAGMAGLRGAIEGTARQADRSDRQVGRLRDGVSALRREAARAILARVSVAEAGSREAQGRIAALRAAVARPLLARVSVAESGAGAVEARLSSLARQARAPVTARVEVTERGGASAAARLAALRVAVARPLAVTVAVTERGGREAQARLAALAAASSQPVAARVEVSERGASEAQAALDGLAAAAERPLRTRLEVGEAGASEARASLDALRALARPLSTRVEVGERGADAVAARLLSLREQVARPLTARLSVSEEGADEAQSHLVALRAATARPLSARLEVSQSGATEALTSLAALRAAARPLAASLSVSEAGTGQALTALAELRAASAPLTVSLAVTERGVAAALAGLAALRAEVDRPLAVSVPVAESGTAETAARLSALRVQTEQSLDVRVGVTERGGAEAAAALSALSAEADRGVQVGVEVGALHDLEARAAISALRAEGRRGVQVRVDVADFSDLKARARIEALRAQGQRGVQVRVDVQAPDDREATARIAALREEARRGVSVRVDVESAGDGAARAGIARLRAEARRDVRLRVDVSERGTRLARERLAALRRETDRDATLRVDVVERGVREARSDVGRLRRETDRDAGLLVDVTERGAREAQGKIAALRAAARRPVQLAVDVDSRAATADAGLLSRAYRRLRGDADDANTSLFDSSIGLRALRGGARTATGAVGSLVPLVGLLVLGVTALSVAAPIAGAALSGAFGAVGALTPALVSLTSLGTGVIGLASGFVVLKLAIGESAKEAAKLSALKEGTKEYAAELAKVPANLRPFTLRLVELRREGEKLTGLARKRVLPALTDFLDGPVGRLLPIARRSIEGLGVAVASLTGRLGAELSSRSALRELSSIAGRNTRLFATLGGAGVQLVRTVIRLTDATGPAVEVFARAAAHGASLLDTFVALNRTKIADFFKNGARDALSLGRGLLDVVVGVSKIGGIAADVFFGSEGLASGFADGAKQFKEFTSSVSGQTKIRAFFVGLKPTLDAVLRLVGGVGRTLGTLSGRGGGLPGALDLITNRLLPALTSLALTIQDNLPTAVAVIGRLADALGRVPWEPIGKAATAIGQVVSQSGGLSVAVGLVAGLFLLLGRKRSFGALEGLLTILKRINGQLKTAGERVPTPTIRPPTRPRGGAPRPRRGAPTVEEPRTGPRVRPPAPRTSRPPTVEEPRTRPTPVVTEAERRLARRAALQRARRAALADAVRTAVRTGGGVAAAEGVGVAERSLGQTATAASRAAATTGAAGAAGEVGAERLVERTATTAAQRAAATTAKNAALKAAAARAIRGAVRDGVIAIVADVATEVAVSKLEKRGNEGAARLLESTKQGAILGATVGSVVPVPGVGSAFGAVVGGGIGAVVGASAQTDPVRDRAIQRAKAATEVDRIRRSRTIPTGGSGDLFTDLDPLVRSAKQQAGESPKQLADRIARREADKRRAAAERTRANDVAVLAREKRVVEGTATLTDIRVNQLDRSAGAVAGAQKRADDARIKAVQEGQARTKAAIVAGFAEQTALFSNAPVGPRPGVTAPGPIALDNRVRRLADREKRERDARRIEERLANPRVPRAARLEPPSKAVPFTGVVPNPVRRVQAIDARREDQDRRAAVRATAGIVEQYSTIPARIGVPLAAVGPAVSVALLAASGTAATSSAAVADAVVAPFSGLPDRATVAATAVGPAVSVAILAGAGLAGAAAHASATSAVTPFLAVPALAAAGVAPLTGALTTAASTAGAALRVATSDAAATAVRPFSDLPDKAALAVSRINSTVPAAVSIDLTASGARVAASFAAGLSSKPSLAAVQGAANKLAAMARDHFPASPPKRGVLRDKPLGAAGVQVATMLAEGMRRGLPAVQDSANAVAAAAQVGARGQRAALPAQRPGQAREAAAARQTSTHLTRYEFHGPIQVPDMSGVVAFAERKRNLAAIATGSNGTEDGGWG